MEKEKLASQECWINGCLLREKNKEMLRAYCAKKLLQCFSVSFARYAEYLTLSEYISHVSKNG